MTEYRVLEMNEKDDEIDIDVGKLPPPLPVDASAPPPPDDLPSYEHCYREYFFSKCISIRYRLYLEKWVQIFS